MTSATVEGRLPQRTAVRGVTFPRVLRSEWTKLWWLRSTRWSLFLGTLLTIAFPVLFAFVTSSHWGGMSPQERADRSPMDIALAGVNVAQLAIAVLGVLVISGEYSTGMIRSSFMAVPRRLPVLWAKLTTYGFVTFVLMLASSFISFFAVQAIVKRRHLQHALSDPHALRAVIGAALFLTVLGALGLGLGALIRNTAGGIAAFVGLLFVLPGVVAILPSSIGDKINPYLPLNAGTTVLTVRFDDSHHLAAWAGFAVFCGYAAVVIGAAAIAMARRDA